MRDQGVGQSQEDILSIKEILRDVQRSSAALRAELEALKGEVQRIPTALQLWAMTVTTWIVGAGTVMLALRLV